MTRTLRLADLAYCALLLFCSLLRQGLVVFGSNQQLQIPLVLHINDPGLFPGDPFVASLQHYASPLWWPMALLARAMPLVPLLVVLGVGARVLTFWAFGRLAAATAPGSRTALVAAWSFAALEPRPFFGDGMILQAYFEQTTVAVACATLAATALIESRPRAFAIWLGLSFNCNILYGIFASSYLALFVLVQHTDWRRFVPAGAAALALATPSVWMSARASRDPVGDAATWVQTLRAYYPEHFFPDSWPRESIVGAVLFAATLAVLALVVRKRDAATAKRTAIGLAVAIFWIGVALLNAYVLRAPGLFVLHPVRGADLAYVLCAIPLLAAFGRELERTDGERLAAAAALALLTFAFFDARRWALLLLVAVAALSRWWPARAAQGARLFLIGGLLLGWLLGRHRPIFRRPPPELQQIADWARRETPREAVFLVDPSWGEFRAVSERQAFVTWKEGAAILWQKSYVATWVDRMKALGVDVLRPGASSLDEAHRAFSRLGPEEALALGRARGIDHWCAPRAQTRELPVELEAGELVCVRLNPSSSSRK